MAVTLFIWQITWLHGDITGEVKTSCGFRSF